MYVMPTTASTRPLPDLARKILYWAWYVTRCALFSLALLYLLFAAEFSAVRAVYEAY